MNDTNTELTVLIDFSQTEKDLAEVESQMRNVVHDVTQPKGMKAAKADVSKLRGMRTTVDKVRLEHGRILLAKKKLNDDHAKALIDRIVVLEEPLKLQIDAYEAEQESKKLAAIEAEQTRVQGHRDYINGLRELPGTLVGKPSSRLNLAYDELVEIGVRDCEEFGDEASDAFAATKARISDMIAAQVKHEAEQEQIRKDREELERMRAENERLAREATERAEADARREREAREQAERLERERLAEGARIERERMEAEQAELRRIEREAQEARQRELDAEAERQAIERKRLDAERAQAAQEAKAARLQALTLNKAAQAVVDWAVAAGYGHEPVIEDLNAVLLKDAAPAKNARAKA